MIALGRKVNYTITIEPTMNGGFFVKVGCGKFSFTDYEDLLSALGDYFENPEKLEKEYNKLSVVPIQEVPSAPVDYNRAEQPAPPMGRPIAYETREQPEPTIGRPFPLNDNREQPESNRR
jgi:hypothetical protein